MSTFLLLVGLALFVGGAAMYFVHAAKNDSRWIAGSIFFPPVVFIYYRRHWDELWQAGLLQSSGLIMAVAGALMMWSQATQPGGIVHGTGEEIFSTAYAGQNTGFVDSERAQKLLVRHGPGQPVAGRVHGDVFRPDRVELLDGVLRLREGTGFFPRREIAVFFAETLNADDGHIKQVISPQTGDAPEVHLSWLDNQGSLETAIFRHGYRLEMDLAPLARNKLGGYVQLVLPDQAESYAAGDVVVVTSNLRYLGENVDRHYDHEDTLRFVAEEYVDSQYGVANIDEIAFENVSLDVLEGRGELLATVTLKDNRIGRHVVKIARNEFGWNVLTPESMAATEAAGYRSVYSALPPASVPSQQAPPVVAARAVTVPARKSSVRTLEFSQLASLTGQGTIAEYRNGRKEQGVLRGMRKDRLVLEAQKGGGVVEYLLSAQDLLQLQMNSGEIVRVAAAAVVTAPPASGSALPINAGAGGASVSPASSGERNFTPFMNKAVKVVTTEGKTVNGVLRSLNDNRLVIEVMVGSGKVDYNIPVDQLTTIDLANP